MTTTNHNPSIPNTGGGDESARGASEAEGRPEPKEPLPFSPLTAYRGHAWQYIVPEFTHPAGRAITGYTATLADGTALPAWLSFDAASRTFSIAADATDAVEAQSLSLSVNVASTDASGEATMLAVPLTLNLEALFYGDAPPPTPSAATATIATTDNEDVLTVRAVERGFGGNRISITLVEDTTIATKEVMFEVVGTAITARYNSVGTRVTVADFLAAAADDDEVSALVAFGKADGIADGRVISDMAGAVRLLGGSEDGVSAAASLVANGLVFVAKNPGVGGNDLKVSVVPNDDSSQPIDAGDMRIEWDAVENHLQIFLPLGGKDYPTLATIAWKVLAEEATYPLFDVYPEVPAEAGERFAGMIPETALEGGAGTPPPPEQPAFFDIHGVRFTLLDPGAIGTRGIFFQTKAGGAEVVRLAGTDDAFSTQSLRYVFSLRGGVDYTPEMLKELWDNYGRDGEDAAQEAEETKRTDISATLLSDITRDPTVYIPPAKPGSAFANTREEFAVSPDAKIFEIHGVRFTLHGDTDHLVNNNDGQLVKIDRIRFEVTDIASIPDPENPDRMIPKASLGVLGGSKFYGFAIADDDDAGIANITPQTIIDLWNTNPGDDEESHNRDEGTYHAARLSAISVERIEGVNPEPISANDLIASLSQASIFFKDFAAPDTRPPLGVVGTEGDDTIPASAATTRRIAIDGGAGDDTITLGDATEEIIYHIANGGADVVNGFSVGSDRLTFVSIGSTAALDATLTGFAAISLIYDGTSKYTGLVFGVDEAGNTLTVNFAEGFTAEQLKARLFTTPTDALFNGIFDSGTAPTGAGNAELSTTGKGLVDELLGADFIRALGYVPAYERPVNPIALDYDGATTNLETHGTLRINLNVTEPTITHNGDTTLYGVFDYDLESGRWVYTLTPDDPETAALPAGAATETITFTVTDTATGAVYTHDLEIDITVTGTAAWLANSDTVFRNAGFENLPFVDIHGVRFTLLDPGADGADGISIFRTNDANEGNTIRIADDRGSYNINFTMGVDDLTAARLKSLWDNAGADGDDAAKAAHAKRLATIKAEIISDLDPGATDPAPGAPKTLGSVEFPAAVILADPFFDFHGVRFEYIGELNAQGEVGRSVKFFVTPGSTFSFAALIGAEYNFGVGSFTPQQLADGWNKFALTDAEVAKVRATVIDDTLSGLTTDDLNILPGGALVREFITADPNDPYIDIQGLRFSWVSSKPIPDGFRIKFDTRAGNQNALKTTANGYTIVFVSGLADVDALSLMRAWTELGTDAQKAARQARIKADIFQGSYTAITPADLKNNVGEVTFTEPPEPVEPDNTFFVFHGVKFAWVSDTPLPDGVFIDFVEDPTGADATKHGVERDATTGHYKVFLNPATKATFTPEELATFWNEDTLDANEMPAVRTAKISATAIDDLETQPATDLRGGRQDFTTIDLDAPFVEIHGVRFTVDMPGEEGTIGGLKVGTHATASQIILTADKDYYSIQLLANKADVTAQGLKTLWESDDTAGGGAVRKARISAEIIRHIDPEQADPGSVTEDSLQGEYDLVYIPDARVVLNHTDGGTSVLHANGRLTITDTDGITTITHNGDEAQYGRFAFDKDTGLWAYRLNPFDPHVAAQRPGTIYETIIFVATDSDGNSAHYSLPIAIRIIGTADVLNTDATTFREISNEGEIENPPANSVTLDLESGERHVLTASGGLSITDTDGVGSITYSAAVYGVFTFDEDTGDWEYTLDLNDAETAAINARGTTTETITFTVMDEARPTANTANYDLEIDILAVAEGRPVAPDDFPEEIVVAEGAALSHVLPEFTHIDGADLTYGIVTNTARDWLTIGARGATAAARTLTIAANATDNDDVGETEVTIIVRDGASGEAGTDIITKTFKLIIEDANQAPTSGDTTASLTATEGEAAVPIPKSFFPFMDADKSSEFNQLRSVIITELPERGRLLLNDEAVAVGAVIAAADLDAGNFKFEVLASAPGGASTDTFKFKVSDGEFETAAHTATVSVTGVDSPVIMEVAESIGLVPGAVHIFTNSELRIADPDTELSGVDLSDYVFTLTAVTGEVVIETYDSSEDEWNAVATDGNGTFTQKQIDEGDVRITAFGSGSFSVSGTDGTTTFPAQMVNISAPATFFGELPEADKAVALDHDTPGNTNRDASGTIRITDSDGITASNITFANGQYGIFTLTENAATPGVYDWTYVLVDSNTHSLGEGDTTETITITVIDDAGNEAMYDLEITITITGMPNLPTTFTSAAEATINEGDVAATTAVYTAEVQGQAGATITYSLKARVGDEELFEINGSTGEVTFKTDTMLDFETTPRAYTFTVIANDGTDTIEQAVTLRIADIDELATGIALSNASIKLPAGIDTTNTIKLEDIILSGDPDGGSFGTLELSGAGAALFTIVGMELHLAAGATLSADAKVMATIELKEGLAGAVIDSVDYTLTVGAAGEADTATTFTPSDSATPTIMFDHAGTTTTAETTGTIAITDAEGIMPQNVTAGQATYGIFTLTHDSGDNYNWTYIFDSADADSLTLKEATATETITLTVTDDSGYRASHDLTIAINLTGERPNTPPTTTPELVIVNEANMHRFTETDFGYADVNGDALDHITIIRPPDGLDGLLIFNGSVVQAGDTIAMADIGDLSFEPSGRRDETFDTSFTYSVSDGTDDSLETTMNIRVAADNDGVTLHARNEIGIEIGTGKYHILAPHQLGVIDPDTAGVDTSAAVFTLAALTGGVVEVNNGATWNPITAGSGTFTQQNIIDGDVRLAATEAGSLTVTAVHGTRLLADQTITFTPRVEHEISGHEIGGADGLLDLSEDDTPRTITTGIGSNKIKPGSGDDIIDPGLGDDDIDLTKRGDDAVIYRYRTAQAATIAWDGGDDITGFEPGVDRILLHELGGDGTGAFIDNLGRGFEATLRTSYAGAGDRAALSSYDITGIEIHFMEAVLLPGGVLGGSIMTILFEAPIGWDSFMARWLSTGLFTPEADKPFNQAELLFNANAAGKAALMALLNLGAADEVREAASRSVAVGNEGDNTISTANESGAWVIFGGGGNDMITLGAGAEEIVYRLAYSTGEAGSKATITNPDGSDTISGFALGTDRLTIVDGGGDAPSLADLLGAFAEVSLVYNATNSSYDAIIFEILADNPATTAASDPVTLTVNFASDLNAADLMMRLGLVDAEAAVDALFAERQGSAGTETGKPTADGDYALSTAGIALIDELFGADGLMVENTLPVELL